MNLLAKVRTLWRTVTNARVIAPEEIEAALRLPIVAIIPHLERRNSLAPDSTSRKRQLNLEGRWRSRLLIQFPEKAPAALAYESLIKELLERSRARRQKVWLMVGSVAGEGTSLSCMNLAIAAARRGVKTLIVEAHARSPRISRILSLEHQPGLTGCLQRALSASNAIQESEIKGVHVLPAGSEIAYPEMLWSAPPFQRLLAEVRSQYELIFVESAPILLYPDAAVLADKVDGIVVVNQFGRTPPERVKKAIEKLGGHQDILLGVLLNDAPTAGRL